MKKILLFLVVSVSVLLSSCKKPVEDTQYASGKMPTSIQAFQNIGGIHGLSCIILDDYDFNEMTRFCMGEGYKMSGPACSEVRKGNSVMRNLDWYQYDHATYLMAIEHTDQHLASLTVCSLADKFTHDYNCANMSPSEANHFMANAADGMNEKGVFIGVNVVPMGEMTTGGGRGEIDYRPKSGINKNKPQLSTYFLARLILDQAKDLHDAERLIRETPWTDARNLAENGYQLHWLIATTEGSFVCEFIDGEPTFTYAASPNSADYGNILTNFSNYLLKNYGTIQSHGIGYERFDLLQANYNSATLEDLARMVFGSKMYSEDYSVPNYFWTEWTNEQFSAEQLITWRDHPETRTGTLWNEFVNAYNFGHANYDWHILDYDYDYSRNLWYTSHSSIWNLANKTLLLDIDEQGLFSISFNLDGSFDINY